MMIMIIITRCPTTTDKIIDHIGITSTSFLVLGVANNES